jgi:tetratricopeptide (TPR) repeat protein
MLGGINLWWVEQRQAETERVVGEHLQRAGVFQEEERWEEARQELGLAEERLAGGGPAVLAERVRTLRMDVAAVTDLDQAALQLAVGRSGGMDYAGADEAFTAAFGRRGLDLASMSPEETADRIRRSAVRARLVAALDVWAVVKENLAHRGGEQVLVVTRLADDDPWRQRLRDPAVRENGAVLENLALEEGVLAQPPISLFLMSKMLDEAGRPAAAESLLRRAQQRYPAEFWIHLSLGELLREFGPVSERSVRLAESVGCSRAALALRPRSAVAHYNLGNVLYEQKRLEDAKVEFCRAIELNPGLADPFNSLGIVLREQGNLEEAGANFRKAIALKTDHADALSNLGLVLGEQGRLEEAEAELRKAVALKLDYVAHGNLGHVLRKQGKPKEAEAEYRKAIAIKPDDCGSHSDLGSILGEQGRLKEAEAEFRKAISLVPNGANVHWTLGNRISLESNGADVHWNLGTALIRLGNLDEAEAEIRKGIALKPNQAPAYAVLGSVLIGLGKLVQAEAEYRKAIALQPDDAAAHMNLGNVLLRLWALFLLTYPQRRQAVERLPTVEACFLNPP